MEPGTVPARDCLTSPPARRPAVGPLWRTVLAAPSRLPVIFFWAVVVVSLASLVGGFRPLVVLPALVLATVATWRRAPVPLPGSGPYRAGAAWALAIAVVWLLVNLPFAGEVLLVQRDPGFLTLQGAWLVDNADPAVPIRTAADVAAQVPGVRLTADAFWQVGDVLQAQGAKTFPALIAMVGWGFGLRGVLMANLVIGAVGLLAVYDVARRLIGPRWGLLPMGALALTTPMLYFSRSAFTEPTNIVLTFGGLAVLWGTARDPRMWRFALGGAMVGATALGRIDGAAVSGGLILGLGVVAALSTGARRRTWTRGLLVTAALSLLMVGLGYVGLDRTSSGYLADHRGLYLQLIGLVAVCVVAALGLVTLLRWRVLRTWLARRRQGLGTVAMWSVVVLAGVLASRPLWMTAHGFAGRPNYMAFISSAQQVAGQSVDGTQSYDEATVTWLLWYLGPVTLVLATAAAALLARQCVRGRHPELVILLATLGIPSLLYLLRPSITPDQIWAMRRLLPAVIPAVLLLAGWLLPRIVRASAPGWRRAAAWVLVASVLVAPLATWGSVVITTEYGGRADQVRQVCDEVRGKRVVVAREYGPPWLPTVRIMCDADVVEVGRPTSGELAQIRQAWGGDVVVLTDVGELLPWAAGEPPAPWSRRAMARWPHSLFPSLSPVRFRTDLWIATVGADGTVAPVPSP